VEPRQILSSGIMASAILHLSFVMLVIFFAEVHPFGSVTAEPIAVDIVAPDEVAQKTQKPSEPPATSKKDGSDSFDLSSTAAPASSPPPAAPPQAAAQPPTATPPQKQAALSQPMPAPKPVASPVPATDRPPPSASPAQSPTPPPAYVPAQPDLSVKYQVLLGLPQDRPGDGFDAPATEKADIASTPIAEFRRHLKTCSTLPKEVAASDKVAIKLRVLMTPDGRLATDPVLIEASASMKGPLLMQSAISALQACQPYAMLPADKYNEWKILDLSFTPRDFGGSS
jgi:outer membrane biosynthesis protein TonB